MKLKLLKLFRIPLFITFIYFALLSYSDLTYFGLLSVVEQIPVDVQKEFSAERRTDELDTYLLRGEKVTGKFKASENNFGILLVRFAKLSGIVTDKIVFRIKEERKESWYYENTYEAKQFQDNQYFTFGFPSITNSKNHVYVFEIESLAGTYENGIGVIIDKSKPALVYKYSAGNMRNYKTLLSFAYKKFIYIFENINYWRLAGIFVISFFIALFIKKKKITVRGVVGFLKILKKNPRKPMKIIIDIKSNYLWFEKKIVKVSKKTSREFSKTKFYLLFLNTNTKKKLAICLLIFLLALTYRFSTSLVSWESLFYYNLGGQGDYDQLIRVSTCAIESFCVGILIYNFLILTPLLGGLFALAGFIGGLKLFFYLMLVLSSMVATLPYFMLARKSWLSYGGLIGGLFLATNDFLTNIALGFPTDNSSVFTFSIFYIVYFVTLNIAKIRWLIILGLVGFFDGLNKVLFLVNNLGAFLLFIPVFFYEKAKKFNKSLFTRSNLKLLAKSALPILIFILIYVVWEIITYTQFFKSRYFLWQLVFQGGRSWSAYVVSDSALINSVLSQIVYFSASAIVMIKRLIELSGLNLFFLAPIFSGMFILSFVKRKFPIKQFILTIAFSTLVITLLILIKENLFKIHEVFAGEYILYNWKTETYVGIYLFFAIIFLSILNFKYSAIKFSLPIITYVAMLVLLAKGAPFARLHTHVIVWSVVLLAFVIDWILLNISKYSILKRAGVIFGPFFLFVFILFYIYPKTEIMSNQLSSGLSRYQNELRYLSWVNLELPKEAIVLGGNKDDLIVLGENINKPIVYNSFFGAALIIPENRNHRAVKQFEIIDQLKNKENFRKNRYIILEENINVWRDRLEKEGDPLFSTSSATLLNLYNYEVKLYKHNPTLNKSIYELVSR